jgi:O-antigen ligase
MVAATCLVLRGSWRFALTAATAAAAAVAVVLVVPRLIASDYAATMNLGTRALIWQGYLQAWSASPVFGLGPGNGFIAAQFLSPFGDEYAAHSNFLYLATDYGVIGILTAVYGFGAIIVRGLRIRPTHRRTRPYLLGAVAVVTALAVHSLVDHTLVIFSYRVALFAIIAISLKRSRDESEPLAAMMR